MGPPSSLACGPGSPWPTCPCARLETNATFGRTWGLIHLSLGTPHPRRPWAYRLCRRPDVGVPFLALTGDSQRLLSSHVALARFPRHRVLRAHPCRSMATHPPTLGGAPLCVHLLVQLHAPLGAQLLPRFGWCAWRHSTWVCRRARGHALLSCGVSSLCCG